MFLYILWLVPVWFLYRWCKERRRIANISERYVYITGCDSGFGNLLARHLDQLGYRVIAGCYTEKGEDELKKICSDRLTTIPLDVTKPESVRKATADIKTLVGEKGLWAVVNNAGISVPTGPTDWLTIEDYKGMLEVNLNGVISVTLSILPLIKKAKGRVVNVASVFGRISPFGGPYCVSKYGVEAFNDSLRLYMLHFGVKVLCIEPGFFKTNVTNIPLMKNSLQKIWDKLPQDTKDDYGEDFMRVGQSAAIMGITIGNACEGNDAFEKIEGRFSQLTDGDLMKVVHCMEHAISAVHPRTRYSPGWDAKFVWLPLSYMPTCIVDRLFLMDSIRPKVSTL